MFEKFRLTAIAALAVTILVAAGDAQAQQTAETVAVYDTDYPFIHYSDTPRHNPIAQLDEKIKSGEISLTRNPQHGYLESLLAALNINPDSQTLVFSKTSLQVDAISEATPRAIYFNDDTYVGWVQKTGIMEVAAMDLDLGPVFYAINTDDVQAAPERATLRCLSCHDSYSGLGGGVPRFLFESAYGLKDKLLTADAVARETEDTTPISERWGGWYVTGTDGGALSLANIQLPGAAKNVPVASVKKGALTSLSALVDTSPYLRPTSDIVALLVLEHQVTVHDQIVRANYKSRVQLSKVTPTGDLSSTSWAQLPDSLKPRMAALLTPLVNSLAMANAAPLSAKVTGNTGYTSWFEAQGVKDLQGRSLRALDLNTRVFKFPLSYLIYSDGFKALPLFVREYVYQRLAQILSVADPGTPYSLNSAADRKAALDILKATDLEFAKTQSARPQGA